jgi:hypothetical protein
MNAWVGWALALAALVIGGLRFGWQGVALAVSVVAFWLLLQFSRAMRTLRRAGDAPVGHVDSAVMLHSKLRAGMRLPEVLALTRSLGQRLDDDGERFRWSDDAGVSVEVQMRRGRLAQWSLLRPAQD